MLDCIKREVRPRGRKDVQFLFFEKQFCCAAVTSSSIKVKGSRIPVNTFFICIQTFHYVPFRQNILYNITEKAFFQAAKGKKHLFVPLLKKERENLALFIFFSLKKRKAVLNYPRTTFQRQGGELVAKAKQGKCPGKYIVVIYDIL